MSKKLTAIYQSVRDSRNENGVARIDSKTVAMIIREKLKLAFPGVKFSVRSDYNSVNIYYTDGPTYDAVNQIAGQYSFGGFDGMIDMAYDYDNWMMPDCSMEVADCRGTAGSRGTVDSQMTDCPAPGAIIVDGGPRYVFVNREMSTEYTSRLAAAYGRKYRIEITDKPHNQYIADRRTWLSELLRRDELELLEYIEQHGETYILTAEHLIA